jgi:hypothetical protein
MLRKDLQSPADAWPLLMRFCDYPGNEIRKARRRVGFIVRQHSRSGRNVAGHSAGHHAFGRSA